MLIKKMLRDIKKHKVQFISIFLMAFLGVLIYAGIGAEWRGDKMQSQKYYKDTNLANIWIYGNKGFDESHIDFLKSIGGVTNVERRLSLDVNVSSFSSQPKLELHFVESGEISKCHVTEGKLYLEGDEGIWLDSKFAAARSLKPKDKITVNFVQKYELEILGLVMNPEYVYNATESEMVSDFKENGFAFASSKLFEKIGGIKAFYTEILVTTLNEKYAAIENSIDTALKGEYSALVNRNDHPSYQMFEAEIKQHKAMGSIFPIVFLLIAALTIVTTMSRLITSQRMQIGTLKALGMRDKKIILHYIGYGFFSSLAGAVLGVIIGPLTIPYLFYPAMSGIYILPVRAPGFSVTFILTALLTVLLCTLATYLTCRGILKENAASALRPKAPKTYKAKKGASNARTPVCEQKVDEKKRASATAKPRLPFALRWNLRDIGRSKVRSVMGVIGTLGCTMLLVCSLCCYRAFGDVAAMQFDNIYAFENKLILKDNITEDKVLNICSEYGGETFFEGSAEIKVNGIRKTALLSVTNKNTMVKYFDKNYKPITLPSDGLAISYKLANILKVKVGDELEWHNYDSEARIISTIAAIYRTPTAQGITLPRAEFERSGEIYRPTSILTAQRELPPNIEGVAKVENKEAMRANFNGMTQAMMTLVYILIFAAVVLAVIVLYNLVVMSFIEREREYATLKIIGMQAKKILGLVLVQTLLLAAVGIVVGVPLGKLLTDFICGSMGDNLDMAVNLSFANVIISALITLTVTLVTTLLFYKKIKKINMVEGLKGVD